MTDIRTCVKLGPGVYMDEVDGTLHFYPEEFLASQNCAVTPESIASAEKTMAEVCREQFGPIPMTRAHNA